MAKITRTLHYLLHKYSGITYPLFLNDHNEDMDIIDNALDGLDDRLEHVEDVIHTVSTQNIDDLMERLRAVEVKVDNNATSILTLTTSLNTVDNKVNTNSSRINVLNNSINSIQSDITELKQCCNNVRTTLVEYGGRLSTNETAINNINAEIERIKADVLGNSQDITTLSTQIQTLINTKQDVLEAGAGIDITDNVISVTANVVGSYDSANENLTIGS